jgi:hypothetical protein
MVLSLYVGLAMETTLATLEAFRMVQVNISLAALTPMDLGFGCLVDVKGILGFQNTITAYVLVATTEDAWSELTVTLSDRDDVGCVAAIS